MSAQQLLNDLLKHLPLRVYGKGPVLHLLREIGFPVNNKTPLQLMDVHRNKESGELVCKLTLDGDKEFTAALTNLKLEITHPLHRKVKEYQAEVAEALSKQDMN